MPLQPVHYAAILAICVLIAVFVYIYIKFSNELIQLFFGYGVPFVKTPDHKVKLLTGHVQLKPGQYFLDVGSGDGKILEAIEKQFPDAHIHGIENSGHPYQLSLERKKEHNLQYTVFNQDVFQTPLAQYNVIYTYLIPYLMPRLWRKIKKECKPGTLLYSSSFTIPKVKPLHIISLKPNNHMYIYQVD